MESEAAWQERMMMEMEQERMVEEMEESIAARVRRELISDGYSIVRQLLPPAAIARARKHLETSVEKHLNAEVAAGNLDNTFAELALEERMARAYAHNPEAAPCSWVPQTKHAFAFQQLLFRDASLCALISELTSGREAVVASRYNCRCKLPGAPGAAFPWHQDHAFFRMQYMLKKQEPKRLLAAWAPLVTVDAANGGVEYAAGSHRRGFHKHHRAGGFMTVKESESLVWREPPGREVAGSASEMRGEIPTLEPGDVMFFTDLSFHRSGLNTSTTARWSADWAYEMLPTDPVCPPLEVAAEQPAEVPPPPPKHLGDFDLLPPPSVTVEAAHGSQHCQEASTAGRGSGESESLLVLLRRPRLVVVAAVAAALCAVVVMRRAAR